MRIGAESPLLWFPRGKRRLSGRQSGRGSGGSWGSTKTRSGILGGGTPPNLRGAGSGNPPSLTRGSIDRKLSCKTPLASLLAHRRYSPAPRHFRRTLSPAICSWGVENPDLNGPTNFSFFLSTHPQRDDFFGGEGGGGALCPKRVMLMFNAEVGFRKRSELGIGINEQRS
jgi:hypothetical protein